LSRRLIQPQPAASAALTISASGRLMAIGDQKQWRIGKLHRAAIHCALAGILCQRPPLVHATGLWKFCADGECCGDSSMRCRSILKIVLAGALAASSLSLSPALAAKAKKISGACAQPNGRCVSDWIS